jgi:ectoine hydroxylase-related dioxygenase (phytanoyl-CoA dioxygenase family)
MEKSYGITHQTRVGSDQELHLEEIRINGYTILKDVLNGEELIEIRRRLDVLNEAQVREFSREELAGINELNTVRLPLAYDDYFLKLAAHPSVNDVVRQLLGDYYILHLQNGIINKPEEEHHQSSWHRDLPYQNFSISSPLAIGALYCIDDFSEDTGGTIVLPFSHKLETVPSSKYMESHKKQVNAPAGSVVVFDSMILHKAGFNRSPNIRRAVNHVYVKPLLKQQIDIPKFLGEKYIDDPALRRFLGYESQVPESVVAWRINRIKKNSH